MLVIFIIISHLGDSQEQKDVADIALNVASDSPVWYQLLPSFPPALYMTTIIDRGWFGRCVGLIGWQQPH